MSARSVLIDRTPEQNPHAILARVLRGHPLQVWSHISRKLFFSVFLGVSLYCLFCVSSGVNGVSPRCVSVVRRLFVKSGLVVFGRLAVVAGSVCKMF